jgi:hypothetical protein
MMYPSTYLIAIDCIFSLAGVITGDIGLYALAVDGAASSLHSPALYSYCFAAHVARP